MEQFKIQNLNVRISGDFNYMWVILAEQTNGEQFAASLGDASFHSLLRHYDVKNILLDCGKMWIFSMPEMTDYLDRTFPALMRGVGVEKISVVIYEEAFSILSFMLRGIEFNHLQEAPQI